MGIVKIRVKQRNEVQRQIRGQMRRLLLCQNTKHCDNFRRDLQSDKKKLLAHRTPSLRTSFSLSSPQTLESRLRYCLIWRTWLNQCGLWEWDTSSLSCDVPLYFRIDDQVRCVGSSSYLMQPLSRRQLEPIKLAYVPLHLTAIANSARHGLLKHHFLLLPRVSLSSVTNSADASLNDSPPELQQLALNFLATFLVVTLLNNDRLFSRHCPRSSSVWALYVALSSLTLPLRQRIQPFATNKALSGPPLYRDWPFYPVPLPRSGALGWSAPALVTNIRHEMKLLTQNWQRSVVNNLWELYVVLWQIIVNTVISYGGRKDERFRIAGGEATIALWYQTTRPTGEQYYTLACNDHSCMF